MEISIKVLVILAVLFLLLLLLLRSRSKEINDLLQQRRDNLAEIEKQRQTINRLALERKQIVKEKDELSAEMKQHRENLSALLSSNLTSIPWLAGMMSDFLTYDLEVEAKKLDWGHDIKRAKKVASIRDIRKDARQRIEAAKVATYQLEYLRSLYPALDDVLDTEYKDLPLTGQIPEYDPVRYYLSKEEWSNLSEDEKNQLALDRYVESHTKTNWQIGRDYELSVCYEYTKKGYNVTTFGSYMGLEDLGRDLIATNAERTLIIQCKYWSTQKTIHEKHIFQLYGTMISYVIDHPDSEGRTFALLVTNTQISRMARRVAAHLGVSVVENHPMIEFPRIKCNIGRGEFGETRIYHLPMDAQYDITQIKNPGEFYAFTVKEAVAHGFRRAYRWHGSQ